MKVIGKIIGMLASFTFILGISMLDGNMSAGLCMTLVSGIVLAVFAFIAYFEEEEARLKLKERER